MCEFSLTVNTISGLFMDAGEGSTNIPEAIFEDMRNLNFVNVVARTAVWAYTEGASDYNALCSSLTIIMRREALTHFRRYQGLNHDVLCIWPKLSKGA